MDPESGTQIKQARGRKRRILVKTKNTYHKSIHDQIKDWIKNIAVLMTEIDRQHARKLIHIF